MALPPFFRGISGGRTNGKQGKCSHTCYFCIPAGCKNAYWGASPNPALRDKMDLLTKWFSKKSILKKVQEKVISAIKTAKTG